jgi:hypothetical protein
VAQARVRQPLHQAEDIVAAVPVAVGPILQVDIDREPAVLGKANVVAYVLGVLIEGLAELALAMLGAALGESIAACL